MPLIAVPVRAPRPTNLRRARATVIIFLLIIIAVITTAIVSTVSLAGGVGTQNAGLTLHRDQAFYAAEAGIQRAYYEVEYGGAGSWANPAWVNGNPLYPTRTGTIGACSYSVTASGGGFNTPVVVTSTGTYASNPPTTCTISATLQPKSTIPAITLGSGVDESGNITVDGNVLVKGNIHLGGSVTINGSIQYGGTQNNLSYAVFNPNIPAPPSVWYDPSNNQTPPSNVINVNSLMDASGAKQITDTSPGSLDFTNHPVIYIKVPSSQTLNLKNINVYGSGTLVVVGDVYIQGGLGDATDAVNVVATGDVQTQGNFRTYGSIYAGGDITHQGQFQVTGIISAIGSMYPTQSNNGAGGATIVRAPPPGFDPRDASGAGSTLLQNFTGPTLK